MRRSDQMEKKKKKKKKNWEKERMVGGWLVWPLLASLLLL